MDLKALGKRIRSLRVQQELSQEKLGEKSDVSYRFIGEIERGEKVPSIETLHKISIGLEIPLVELLRFEHEVGTKREVTQQIKALLGEMNEEELRFALKLLRAVKY